MVSERFSNSQLTIHHLQKAE